MTGNNLMQSSKSIRSSKKIVLFTLYILALAVLFYYLWDGINYYITPFIKGPHHPDHQNVKPGGIRGHGVGILGTMMLIFILCPSC